MCRPAIDACRDRCGAAVHPDFVAPRQFGAGREATAASRRKAASPPVRLSFPAPIPIYGACSARIATTSVCRTGVPPDATVARQQGAFARRRRAFPFRPDPDPALRPGAGVLMTQARARRRLAAGDDTRGPADHNDRRLRQRPPPPPVDLPAGPGRPCAAVAIRLGARTGRRRNAPRLRGPVHQKSHLRPYAGTAIRVWPPRAGKTSGPPVDHSLRRDRRPQAPNARG